MVLNSSEKTFSLRTEGLRRKVFAELFNAIELFIVIEKKLLPFIVNMKHTIPLL